MSNTEARAVKTLVITMILLLAAASLLFAGIQERVITQSFSPDKARPLVVKVDGDGAEVFIKKVPRDGEGRARYQYNEDHFSASMEWDPDRNRFETIIDMNGLDFETDDEDKKSELELLLPATSPVDLDFTLKAGAVKLNAEGLEFQDFEFALWAGEFKAEFPTPSRKVIKRVNIDVKMGELNLEGLGNLAFEVMDLNGFAGVTTLDFQGSIAMKREVRVDLEVGEINVIVPKGMTVQARISKLGFLAEVNIPRGWSKDGKYVYSPGARRGEAGLRLDIRGGIGQINIEER